MYVWRVGDELAVKVTDDGTSYFASWSGNEMIASRPSESGSDDARPVSVSIDPATQAETDAGDLWRPVVDALVPYDAGKPVETLMAELGLTELVRTWGFMADAAADGEEALQKITAFRPSIVISDLVMPRMGGLDLLRAVKDEGGDLTIVILTAQGTVETAVEALKEGVARTTHLVEQHRPKATTKRFSKYETSPRRRY